MHNDGENALIFQVCFSVLLITFEVARKRKIISAEL